MNYTVVWRPTAQKALTDIWLNAINRQAVTDAADAIDSLLRTDPFQVGESRASNTRVLAVLPLTVYYDVHDEDRLAAVWAVWSQQHQ